jgi:hypothetical protein
MSVRPLSLLCATCLDGMRHVSNPYRMSWRDLASDVVKRRDVTITDLDLILETMREYALALDAQFELRDFHGEVRLYADTMYRGTACCIWHLPNH